MFRTDLNWIRVLRSNFDCFAELLAVVLKFADGFFDLSGVEFSEVDFLFDAVVEESDGGGCWAFALPNCDSGWAGADVIVVGS